MYFCEDGGPPITPLRVESCAVFNLRAIHYAGALLKHIIMNRIGSFSASFQKESVRNARLVSTKPIWLPPFAHSSLEYPILEVVDPWMDRRSGTGAEVGAVAVALWPNHFRSLARFPVKPSSHLGYGGVEVSARPAREMGA